MGEALFDFDEKEREAAAHSATVVVADRASLEPFGHVEDYPFHTCKSRVERVLHERDVMAAILCERGSFAHIAARLGFTREQVRAYILTNPTCAMLHKQVVDTVLDISERNQMDAAVRGDLNAGKFLLTTIGKDRGYTTKTSAEVSGPDGGAIPHRVEVEFVRPEPMSDEE